MGRLEAFCVAWMPTPAELRVLQAIPPLRQWATRLERRCFPPLLRARRVEGRFAEWQRLLRRVCLKNTDSEALAYQANDWLMRTMKRECRRSTVTAVHSYEDCSAEQFEEAKRLGKTCIYDLPIGYYPAWERRQEELTRGFAEWLPPNGLPSRRHVRPAQKQREMELADLVLVPSTFVENTVRQFIPRKKIAVAPYGVDADFWRPPVEPSSDRNLRFIYAGQVSVRKGVPVLLNAWRKARLCDATLDLVGPWQLNERLQRRLPPNVAHYPACSSEQLRLRYQSADIFVFPSYFEGLALVLLEAMACGLPVIASDASGVADVLQPGEGAVIDAGNEEMLIETLRSFEQQRSRLPQMKLAARAKAEKCSWERYRKLVSEAVGDLC